ncbi:HAMP domain-containing sensor histidine kinase [Intrasporangium sp. YIM S08009]|uniref:sensor histidine kinase n=1 Tax=Intrasporangium zincisolvens TaxID=3080018 RepID=UPI002B055E27|nr:HAMP domain-containing sensor histidine kinase [Intrasporangium sp. YIM S08009]
MGRIGQALPTPGDRAARQGAWLFLVAGVLALLAIAVGSPRPGVLVAVAAADLATAETCLLLPWGRWPVTRIAGLSLIAFFVLGVSTWAFGGQPGGTIPFCVLTFAWLGLHQPPRLVVWAAVPAAVSYVVGLVAAGAAPEAIGGSVVLVPVLVAVGYVIARTMHDLRESQLRLQAQEQWRAAMTATLAHDVRSPLTSITGALELLADDPGTPPALAPLVESASRQAERIARLAGDLLDLERIDQGRLRLDRTQVDVRALAERVAELTDPRQVRVEVPAGLSVLADRGRLEQILVNLTNNAVRHGAGPVCIGAEQEPGAVVLSVRDHGLGVPPEATSQLFTRLADGRPGTDSVGLGLWIVRMLTEAHGGSVSQENTDPGAVFRVRLPQPGPEATPAGRAEAASAPAGSGRSTPGGGTRPAG